MLLQFTSATHVFAKNKLNLLLVAICTEVQMGTHAVARLIS